ncbi:MAG: transcriptional regulator [Rhodobacteraceae bacterium]|nr:transcriptional regulator [Paracoccaceae bacterium]
MLGKIFGSLFSGKADNTSVKAEAVLHEGYEIFAEPRPSGAQWQVAGRIEKDIDGTRKSHVFIRADTMPSADEASEHMIRKAKVMIDQQGESLFH